MLKVQWFLLILLLVPFSRAQADKVIMKDGKIYEGHVMGETNHAILFSGNPLDPTPRFIPLAEVQTIVRTRRPREATSADAFRFVSTELLLTGNFFTSDRLSLHDAAGLSASGGFRIFRFLELDADATWIPSTAGQLIVTDGTNTRAYESFFTYSSGFSVRLFPAYNRPTWPVQLYLLTGYTWDRVIPKGSGDSLKGTSLLGGVGISRPLGPHLMLEGRFIYRRSAYDHVDFLGRQGDLDQTIHLSDYVLSSGLAYHW